MQVSRHGTLVHVKVHQCNLQPYNVHRGITRKKKGDTLVKLDFFFFFLVLARSFQLYVSARVS